MLPKLPKAEKTDRDYVANLILGLILLALLIGCGDGSDKPAYDATDSGSVRIIAEWNTDISEIDHALPGTIQTASPSGDVCDDYLINSITCNIYSASNERVASETWSCAARSGTITCPAGSDIRVELQGLVGDEVLWSGLTTAVTVNAGGSTDVTVEMDYIGTDETAPVVGAVTPSIGETAVTLNSVLTATFDEDVVGASLSTTTFKLDDGSTPISGSVSYNPTSRTATFLPDAELETNTSYTATITQGVEDLAGIPLESDYVWNFSTGDGPDLTPPTVNFTNPGDDETDVLVDSNIEVTFSEPIDAFSITNSSFFIENGGIVSGDISVNGPTSFTLNPHADLSFNTTYQGTITTDAMDSAGNNMASTFWWSFTTQKMVIWPKLQYTIRDIPPDGVPDVFVGADPFLDIKPGTEDRAVLEYDIYAVSPNFTDAKLSFYMGTLDPGGTVGTIYVYWFEADGFSNLNDWYPTYNDPESGGSLVTFAGPNTSGLQYYSFSIKDAMSILRGKGRGYIGFLFLATTNGLDRFYIQNASTGGLPEERAKLEID